MKRSFTFVASAAVLSALAGCGDSPEPKVKSTSKKEADEHPAHGDGPHGGAVTDWGGGAYHVEFTVDHDKQQATVYILGGDEKTPAPITAESIHLVINEPLTELDLAASPLEGELEGTSSRFVGTHQTIGIVREFTGTIEGEVEGTPYTGNFAEKPHDEDKEE